MFSQVDEEGRSQLVMESIIDHRSDDYAVTKENGLDKVGGTTRQKRTTKGWELKYLWKDGTKNADPVKVAKYAVSAGIADEPAFAWWVPYTLKKRDVLIKKVKGRYWKTTHKYGIKLPHSVPEAHNLD